ncbi:hypothetical protein HK405_006198, partial [Cladochytrium tenue]
MPTKPASGRSRRPSVSSSNSTTTSSSAAAHRGGAGVKKIKMVPAIAGIYVKDSEEAYKAPVYAAEMPGTRPADGSET